MTFRTESDSLGEIQVPEGALWGAQTQRAIGHFPNLGYSMPYGVIQALALIKKAAALANLELGELQAEQSSLIVAACDEVLSHRHDEQFPLSIWQSGSGTQSNMNMNEVVANRANELAGHMRGEKTPVHPNDHVNRSQSSNDVFPTAMHLAVLSVLEENLLPHLTNLRHALAKKQHEFSAQWKVGRTHLMDAAPMTLGQEFSGYVAQLDFSLKQLQQAKQDLLPLAIGGTAVGTGLNTPGGWQEAVIMHLRDLSGMPVVTAPNKFAALSTHNAMLRVSSALRQIAADFMVIGNNLRMLTSGPRAGLSEIQLPANEPGSSIMPGKVNPTQIESLTMIATQVIGNDAAVAMACSQGHLQLNVFKPLIVHNVLSSVELLGSGADYFSRYCLTGMDCNTAQLANNVERSLMIVTALAPELGYDKAAEIAKHAQQQNQTIREVLIEQDILSGEAFDALIREHVLVDR
ncbi:MAG: class II fumarate hydratase [Porticoccus sp.]|jgi:fumarate hydratase class II|uniref:class II fumarate hydratase n=1 Tax=Porticoccus sp. TaxID=2024853 RepID=UPI0032977FA3